MKFKIISGFKSHNNTEFVNYSIIKDTEIEW